MVRIPASSGRFLLRLPPALHRMLQTAAARSGLSLNEYCLRQLAASGSAAALRVGAAELVRRAAEIVGDDLVGVVLYGSWARGTTGRSSDIDVLVVVEPRLTVTRALYAAWDTQAVVWGDRRVDPLFVHPPNAGLAGGAWGEAALDGVILFERDLSISTALAGLRHDIAAGRLQRRVVHGQPYWIEAA